MNRREELVEWFQVFNMKGGVGNDAVDYGVDVESWFPNSVIDAYDTYLDAQNDLKDELTKLMRQYEITEDDVEV